MLSGHFTNVQFSMQTEVACAPLVFVNNTLQVEKVEFLMLIFCTTASALSEFTMPYPAMESQVQFSISNLTTVEALSF